MYCQYISNIHQNNFLTSDSCHEFADSSYVSIFPFHCFAMIYQLVSFVQFVVCSAVGRGRAGRPEHDQQHCYHQAPTVNQRLLLQLL